MGQRVCKLCSKPKPLTEYHRQRDGHRRVCKVCRNGQIRTYRDTPVGQAKEKALNRGDGRRNARKRWRGSGRGQQMIRDWRAQPSEQLKARARSAVFQALRDGLIVRPEVCPKCGDRPGFDATGNALIQAHHNHGYEEEHWLDVVWECLGCHRESHFG